MIKIINNYSLAESSYIKIGGYCKKYIESDDFIQLKPLLTNKFIAISNCSKILFAFSNTDCMYIKYTHKKIVFHHDSFFVYAGMSLMSLYQILQQKGIAGFEFLATIPGLIGGSIVNNASFLNQSISDLLIRVLVYENNKLHIIDKNNLDISYRHTNLRKNNILVIGAEFKIKYDNQHAIKKRYYYALSYRQKHQITGGRTLGSTFKNPPSITIGKVIESLHLKGFYIDKNVAISRNHGNFIVVKDNATYLQIYHLITLLKYVLYNYLGKIIELEIIVIDQNGNYSN